MQKLILSAVLTSILMLSVIFVPLLKMEASPENERITLDLEPLHATLSFELPQGYILTDSNNPYNFNGKAEGPPIICTITYNDGSKKTSPFSIDSFNIYASIHPIDRQATSSSELRSLLLERASLSSDNLYTEGDISVPGDDGVTFPGYYVILSEPMEGNGEVELSTTEGELVIQIESWMNLFWGVFAGGPGDGTLGSGSIKLAYTVDNQPLIPKHLEDIAKMIASVRVVEYSSTVAFPFLTTTEDYLPIPEYPNQVQGEAGDPFQDVLKEDIVEGFEKRGVASDNYHVNTFYSPSDTAEEIIAFYRQELTASGWQVLEERQENGRLYLDFYGDSCHGQVFIDPAPIHLSTDIIPAGTPLTAMWVEYGANFGKVIQVQGEVFVKEPDSSDWQPVLTAGEIISSDDGTMIRTGQGDVLLEDLMGQDEQVFIGDNTEVKIKEQGTILDVIVGKIRAVIEKLKPDSKFEVKTPKANMSVRGTDFIVDVAAEQTTVLVFEGTVELSDLGGQKTVLVEEGESSTVIVGGLPSKSQKFDSNIIFTKYLSLFESEDEAKAIKESIGNTANGGGSTSFLIYLLAIPVVVIPLVIILIIRRRRKV
jgi:hypothetical protein